MKQYVVCKNYRVFNPDVVEQFDDPNDAQQFAALMEKTHPDTQYAVYERVEYKLEGTYERKPDNIDTK